MEEVKLSLEDLKLSTESLANIERRQQRRQYRRTSTLPFIRGPIPMWWITRAANLPAKSLHIALAVWSVHHCAADGVVRINHKLLSQFGVSRDSAYRALTHLHDAGLIRCRRHQGRLATVRLLLEPPNTNPEEAEPCPTMPHSTTN